MSGRWTYIMTNRPRCVLNIGVTANLPARIWQHRNGEGSPFAGAIISPASSWPSSMAASEDAIAREKAMKAWKREWKIELIEQANPKWLSLWI